MFFLTLDIMIIYYRVRKNHNTYGSDDYGVWEVCKVPSLKKLSWFLLCLGSRLTPPSPIVAKDLMVQTIVQLKSVQINYEGLLNHHDTLFQKFTQLLPFFFSNQDIVIKNKSLFLEHIWI